MRWWSTYSHSLQLSPSCSVKMLQSCLNIYAWKELSIVVKLWLYCCLSSISTHLLLSVGHLFKVFMSSYVYICSVQIFFLVFSHWQNVLFSSVCSSFSHYMIIRLMLRKGTFTTETVLQRYVLTIQPEKWQKGKNVYNIRMIMEFTVQFNTWKTSIRNLTCSVVLSVTH